MNKTKKLSDFQALLFDVDRTLTNSKGEISYETIESLKKLTKKGFNIGICSGRGTPALKNKIFPLFPNNSLHITAGGSQLVDSNGKLIWQSTIDSQTVKNIKKILETKENKKSSQEKTGNNTQPQIIKTKTTQPAQPQIIKTQTTQPAQPQIIKTQTTRPQAAFMKIDALYTKEPMLTNLKKNSWKFIVKNLNKMSDDGVGAIYILNFNNKILKYIKNNNNLSFKQMTSNSNQPYIDITKKGVNKAVALKQWSKHTNIPLNKIIGFGDGNNDIEFLSACGFSVVMGNAVEELKQIADRIIGNVNNNGLAKYLSKIIKGDNL